MRRVSIFTVPYHDRRLYAQCPGSIKEAKARLRRDHSLWCQHPIAVILTYMSKDASNECKFWLGGDDGLSTTT